MAMLDWEERSINFIASTMTSTKSKVVRKPPPGVIYQLPGESKKAGGLPKTGEITLSSGAKRMPPHGVLYPVSPIKKGVRAAQPKKGPPPGPHQPPRIRQLKPGQQETRAREYVTTIPSS